MSSSDRRPAVRHNLVLRIATFWPTQASISNADPAGCRKPGVTNNDEERCVMRRREFFIGLPTVGLAGVFKDMARASQRDAGPHFLSVSRGNGRVFLLGFGEAKDDSWVTPRISRAFDKSSTLWLEVGHGDSSPGPETRNRIEELSHVQGRNADRAERVVGAKNR